MELVTRLRPPVSALALELASVRASKQAPPNTSDQEDDDGIPF